MIKKINKRKNLNVCPVCHQQIALNRQYCPFCNTPVSGYKIQKKRNMFRNWVAHHRKALIIGVAILFILIILFKIGYAAYINWQDSNTVIGINAEYKGEQKEGTVIDSNSPFVVTVQMRNGEKKEVDDWTITEPVTLEKGTISGVEIQYKNKSFIYTLGGAEE